MRLDILRSFLLWVILEIYPTDLTEACVERSRNVFEDVVTTESSANKVRHLSTPPLSSAQPEAALWIILNGDILKSSIAWEATITIYT